MLLPLIMTVVLVFGECARVSLIACLHTISGSRSLVITAKGQCHVAVTGC